MTATYLIRPLNSPFSEIVEVSTGVRVHLGTDCIQFAEKFGLTYKIA